MRGRRRERGVVARKARKQVYRGAGRDARRRERTSGTAYGAAVAGRCARRNSRTCCTVLASRSSGARQG